ncbi:MAG TPA: hypothetical protein VNZ26_28970 [Vicinamibacterales bacterium]|nr:hypothetical protein [Vicinamibacterales bacterium]
MTKDTTAARQKFRRYASEGGTSKAAGAALGVNLTSEARKRGARAPTNQPRTAPGEAGRAAGQKSTRLLAGGTRGWELAWSVAFLCIGCALRLAQYFADTSQWVDEVMLSSSIVTRTLSNLLSTPLAFQQSAPPGFLLLQRLAVVAFGTSDMALRLFPALCGMGILAACFGLSRLALQGASRPIALALVATAAPLVIFSAQAKQYSLDVATAVLLLLLVAQSSAEHLGRSRVALLVLAGVVTVWLSNSAPLVLAGASVALLGPVLTTQSSDRRRNVLRLLPIVGAWGLASALSIAVAHGSVSADTRRILFSYWTAGFMPMPPWRIASFAWPLQAFSRIFGGIESAGLWYPMNRGYAALSLLGFWSLWRRSARLGLLFVAPFAVTLLAAAAHQYPFRDRLVLFLVPSALFGVAEGIRFLADLAERRHKYLGVVVMAALAAPPLYRSARSLPPYQSEDIKPLLQHLRARLRPSDRLYVYYGASNAFGYYASQYDIGLEGVLFGECHYGDARRHLEQLDQLRGQPRVWVLFTHVLPDQNGYNERQDILAYLDAIGTRRDTVIRPPHHPAGSYATLDSADLYLYDLSEPARLALTSSASFAVQSKPLLLGIPCE